MNPLNSTSGLEIAVVIVLIIIFFYIYFYFVTSGLPEKYSNSIIVPAQKEIVLFLIKKISGFIILGLIPGLLYYFLLNQDFAKFGLSINHFNKNFLIILSLILVITTILFFNQKANRNNNSLQINLSEWNIALFSINSFGWIFYLIGYEFLFRGILLFECYNSFGFWPAIAINVAIYSAIHMVNGKDQAIGSLIFGVIACYLTLSQGSILIPLIMHISLSIMSDYFSIRYNVSLSFIKQPRFNLPSK
ncbi:MAG TPA: CPBP family intramembrane glutamic endopeptidase [Draconibacterium sp.]|nr:CPBP family intramembrane glutamic endopeptidase [Draconibacterium sp.]